MIFVNGKAREFTGALTVAELLVQMELDPQRVAVDRGGGIVRRADFAETVLADGDCLEVVQFVGGG